ncbi:hypothetical protein TorRG33x02_250320 [Trema orientale]|uniref:Uncharacterized protein n=1 Tax=Trema orientale TaxID=63057 RepID=A0A2P5DJ44_TREOI|nr:hypothetical protein TorRG33x02_250320 [Trema orientale]
MELAIEVGLEMNLSSVFIESDSQVGVKSVTTIPNSVPWEVASVVEHITNLLVSSSLDAYFVWIPRTCNNAAQFLWVPSS